MAKILVIDDEEAVCWALQKALTAEGYQTSVSASAEDALGKARATLFDVIVLDVRLPGMDGLSALAELRALSDNAPIIVITAFGNLSTAVRAVEGGAFDYLAKPFDLDHALETIRRALRHREQTSEERSPTTEPTGGSSATPELLGSSQVMQDVFKRIALVAPRNSCVLITGESGVGKELAARAVHRYSKRADKPLLAIHVAALNPNLVESELFGHVKGAFTGASEARTGLMAQAEGGTVFFDEVAEIPLPVQVKLLRVLENQEILAVGDNEPRRVDIRVLAATHQDLAAKVADGSFRQDLYYRLNVFQIHLPPLRDRREDIVLLAEHFLKGLEPGQAKLLPGTVKYLYERPWVGNVRELRNALEHAVILSRGGPLLPEHFPPEKRPTADAAGREIDLMMEQWLAEQVRTAGPDGPRDLYERFLATVEPPLLAEVMRRVQGNRVAAAVWLGLNRATVRKKLVEYGLADATQTGE